jgi:fumarate hydratase subunit beta
MKNREITLPLSADAVGCLRVGDEVELTGALLTGRDQACAKIFHMIQSGDKPPVELKEELIYFVGPSPTRPGGIIGSAGPTTSERMNAFIPTFLRHGLRGFVGKGYISQEAKKALTEYGGVYFGAIGGTGALLSQCIESAEVIAFPELLSEAVHRIQFNRFPVVVLNDARGGDLYSQVLENKA